ncbi:MAG TPA: hypothetical protein VK714_03700 [Myxococcota bacterium]|nr:hypothetical protein [Myxococcota bacterium]
MTTLTLTTLDPADFPTRLAVRDFVLSRTFEALSVAVRSVLGHQGGKLVSRLAERARGAAFWIESDLCALAQTAAGEGKTIAATWDADFGGESIERLGALLDCAEANETTVTYLAPICELIERYQRRSERAA